MQSKFISSPHLHSGLSVPALMLRVCLALVPGIVVYCSFFGWGVIIQCLLCILFALAFEYIALRLRKRPTQLFIKDGSALLTAVLFALTISPFSPWWASLLGLAFAILIAKHAYGGLGNNPFNPAMAGYVFVLLCFPAEMNQWPQVTQDIPGFKSYLGIIFDSGAVQIDALSGATALNDMKTQLNAMNMVSEIRLGDNFGQFAGRGWEWIGMAYLFGGIALLLMGCIRWHIPLAMLFSLVLASMLFNLFDSDVYPSPMFQVFSGGTLLCAFFIATDPVSAATSLRGKLVYGALIGLLVFVIRTWGSYPDGIAFAVLIANASVPLIDKFTRPPVIGEQG